MNKAQGEYVERYLAIPRDHEVGVYRRSICVKGYRHEGKFRELVNGRLTAAVDEDWLMEKRARQ